MKNFEIEIGEELREEFEYQYGKNCQTKFGQYLDLYRLPCGTYRSMVTFYTWAGYRHGKGVYNPNDKYNQFSVYYDPMLNRKPWRN